MADSFECKVRERLVIQLRVNHPPGKRARLLAWIATIASAVLLINWIGSAWYVMMWNSTGGGSIGIASGQLGIAHSSAGLLQPGWEFRENDDLFNWWFTWVSLKRLWFLMIPLWVPLIATTSVAAFCWHRRLWVSSHLNRCPKCKYDRAGLAPAAACPECNSAAPVYVRPYSKIRKHAKWVALVLMLALLGVWLFSGQYSIFSARHIDSPYFSWGRVWYQNRRYWERSFPRLATNPPWKLQLGFVWEVEDDSVCIAIPLWIAPAITLLPTSFLWYRHFRAVSRIRSNRCVKCRYDLRGLAMGATCPECGESSI